MSMALLSHAKLPLRLWPFAIMTATYLINRIHSTSLDGKSPFEIWYDKLPNLKNIRTFGVDAWVRTEHSKGANKAKLCIFLGYSDGLKGYVLIDKNTGKVLRSGDAKFYEDDKGARENLRFCTD